MTVAGGPEDRVLDSIYSAQDRRSRLAVKIGEVYVSVAEPVIWLPFLILLLIGWISIVAFLPAEMGTRFIDLTAGSFARAVTDFSLSVLPALVGNIAGLVLTFYLYIRVVKWVVGRVLARTP